MYHSRMKKCFVYYKISTIIFSIYDLMSLNCLTWNRIVTHATIEYMDRILR